MKYKKDRPCPKCGEVGATTEYRGDIERRCRNCGYYWIEEPLDEDTADKEGGKG